MHYSYCAVPHLMENLIIFLQNKKTVENTCNKNKSPRPISLNPITLEKLFLPCSLFHHTTITFCLIVEYWDQ